VKPKTTVKSFKKYEISNALFGTEGFVQMKKVEVRRLTAMMVVIVVMSLEGSATSRNFMVYCHFTEFSTCEFKLKM
jgi:hypothetical protein